jgi:hypothetical protein
VSGWSHEKIFTNFFCCLKIDHPAYLAATWKAYGSPLMDLGLALYTGWGVLSSLANDEISTKSSCKEFPCATTRPVSMGGACTCLAVWLVICQWIPFEQLIAKLVWKSS